MKKSTMLLATVLGLVGVGASSVQAAPLDENKWELTLAGSGTNDNDFESGAFAFNGTLGYYVTPQVEVLVRQIATYANFEDGGDEWSGATNLGVQYHFDFGQDQRIIPFVGANIGYTYGDVDDSITAAPEAGVKFYVNDTTFVFGQVSYDFLLKESFGDGRFNYAVGVGFRF